MGYANTPQETEGYFLIRAHNYLIIKGIKNKEIYDERRPKNSVARNKLF
jgi:hypothetical protein